MQWPYLSSLITFFETRRMENLESLVLQTFELESNMVLCNYYNIDAIILSGNGETPRVWKFGFGGSPNRRYYANWWMRKQIDRWYEELTEETYH